MTDQEKSTSGQRGIKTDYPVEYGLIAETTKQTGTQMHLIPQLSKVSNANNKNQGIR